jgi:DNA-binding NarL/FixJ family response regulator
VEVLLGGAEAAVAKALFDHLEVDRVLDGAQFADNALRRVAGGGTAMDPEVVARLLDRNSGNVALGTLSPRERDVLCLMAEGRSMLPSRSGS